MSALSLIATLFVGVVFGILVMSLMIMARDGRARDEGAAALAEQVLDVVSAWERSPNMPGTSIPNSSLTIGAIYEIKMHCTNATQRAERHENPVNYDSPNG